MGAAIGHEITHGFDDEGSQFDAKGNLRDWWTKEDRKNFDERAGCVQKQFDGYEVEPGLHENGKLVLGESIADLGGLAISYAAYEKSIEGKRPATLGGFTPGAAVFPGVGTGMGGQPAAGKCAADGEYQRASASEVSYQRAALEHGPFCQSLRVQEG